MAVEQYLYPFDPTGQLASNLVTNEQHSVSAAQGKNLSFIVPVAAPFFSAGLVVSRKNGLSWVPMVEGVDYMLTHRFVEASSGTGHQIYGSISLIDRTFTGIIRLRYQTLGGRYTLDDRSIVTDLTNSLYNVRTVTWAQIVGLPVAFGPLPHEHDYSQTAEWDDVVAKMEEIRLLVANYNGDPGTMLAQLAAHIANATNAHSKGAVGLGNVQNYGMADATAAQAGTRADLYMSPLSVAQALTTRGSAKLNTPRNIALNGDVTGNVNFDGSQDVIITAVLADRIKFYENTAFSSITDGTLAIDPNTATQSYFLTRHANSPDNSASFHWYILNFSQGTSGNVARRGQIAIEFVGDLTRAPRVASRSYNGTAWTPWAWTSGHQYNMVDGRRYGDGTTSATPDTILDRFCRIQINENDINGLPDGTYLMETLFDNATGVLPTVTQTRLQIAYRLAAPEFTRDKAYIRYFNAGTWQRWARLDDGGGRLLTTTDLDTIVTDGTYRQRDTGVDYTGLHYPTNNNGTLLVYKTANVSTVAGIRQIYMQSNNLARWERRLTSSGPNVWSAWVQVTDADGNVPADRLPTVPLDKGGTGATTAAGARSALELQNGAITNIVVSDTEPVSPPPNTLWLKPTVP